MDDGADAEKESDHQLETVQRRGAAVTKVLFHSARMLNTKSRGNEPAAAVRPTKSSPHRARPLGPHEEYGTLTAAPDVGRGIPLAHEDAEEEELDQDDES